MNDRTLKLTTGAMFTAIFGILMLLNRQTGGAFQELVIFLMPIPMVGYSSKYGFKSGVPVVIAMGLISVIFGTPLSIFYGVSESIIGLVLGSAVYAKKDMTKTMLAVMGLSALVNVLDMIVLATLFGYNLSDEIDGMQTMMNQALTQSGAPQETMVAMEAIMTPSFLMKIMVISVVLIGLAQGFIVYKVSLLILRRLKFYVPKPTSMLEIRPPFWSAIIAGGAFLGYNITFAKGMEGLWVSALQMLGICGYLYLIFFGMLFIMIFVRRFVTKNGIVGGIIAFLGLMAFPGAEMLLGIFYCFPVYYNMLMGDGGKARGDGGQAQGDGGQAQGDGGQAQETELQHNEEES